MAGPEEYCECQRPDALGVGVLAIIERGGIFEPGKNLKSHCYAVPFQKGCLENYVYQGGYEEETEGV